MHADTRAMKVADIMTKNVVALFEEDDLRQIEAAMDKFGFHHVPVVDDGKLVGLVTQRDILRVLSSRFDASARTRDDERMGTLFVRDVMTANVESVGPDAPITECARIMRDKRIGCLPVVDSDRRVLGIVTTTDLLDFMVALLQPK